MLPPPLVPIAHRLGAFAGALVAAAALGMRVALGARVTVAALVTLAALVAVAAPLPAQSPVAATTVRGQLLDGDERPLRGVRIAIAPRNSLDVAAVLAKPLAVSDEQGRFTVVAPRQGANDALLFAGDQLAHTWLPLPEQAERIELGALCLAPGYRASGRVRDPAGAPIADVEVVCTDLLDGREFLDRQARSFDPRCRTAARSDDRGIFQLPGAILSAAALTFHKPGFLDVTVQPIAVGDPIAVTMRPTPAVRGRVFDAEGAPAAGATVQLGATTTTTDAEGRFELLPHEAARPSLSAWRAENDGWQSVGQSCAPPGDENVLRMQRTVVPARPNSVVLQVRSDDGAPVAAFQVRVAWGTAALRRTFGEMQLLARAAQRAPSAMLHGRNGAATVAIDPAAPGDEGIVLVHAEGRAATRVTFSIDPAPTEPIVVTLPPEAIVRGRVLEPMHSRPRRGVQVAPYAHARAFLRQAPTNEGADAGNTTADVTTWAAAPNAVLTDADGNFELRGLAAGAHDLHVSGPGLPPTAPRRIHVTAAETLDGVDLFVPDCLALHGNLDGALAPGAHLRLRLGADAGDPLPPTDDPTRFAAVHADGGFQFAGLAPQRHALLHLLPRAPRTGGSWQLHLHDWDGDPGAAVGATAAQPLQLPAPATRVMQGTVDGAVPWSRLGVAAAWQIRGRAPIPLTQTPYTLVRPDRTFRFRVPAHRLELLLFDVLTGIPIERFDVDAADADVANDDNVRWPFAGTAVPLHVTPPDGDATVVVEYEAAEPEAHRHSTLHGKRRSGWPCGATFTLWLPERSGTVKFRAPGSSRTIDLAATDADSVDLRAKAVAPADSTTPR